MRLWALRPLPLAMFAVTVVTEVAAAVLSWGLEPLYDTLLYVAFAAALAGTGALVLSRYPRHPIGWLLCGNGLFGSVAADLAQGWGLRAAAEGWAGGPVAEWIQTASWLPTAPVLVLTVLLFPDGRLPGRRWRGAVWVSVGGVVLAEPGWTLNPDSGSMFVHGRNPFAVTWLPTDLLFGVGFSLIAASLVAALIGLIVRFRRSEAVERQQLKWFAFACAVMVVALPSAVAMWYIAAAVGGCTGCQDFALILPSLALTAWAVVIGIAILRHRLYDIDLVISRAIAYVTLTAILGAVFAVAVLLLGTVGGRGSPIVTAIATLAAATVFHLLRTRVQDRIDRRFRRARHDALRRVAVFLDELRAGRAEPEEVTAVLRAALGDPQLELRFVLQPGEPPVDERGRPATDAPDDGYQRFSVRRAGVALAEVVRPAGSAAQQALVPGVVDAAGLAIEMARLRVELRCRLDEVEASRARIVSVADEERRRIERDLHDGAQQRLVSIGLALRHAQHQLGPAAGTAGRTLDEAIVQISEAIAELRELAQGLHPALDTGLRPALRDLATRVPLPVDVAATTERYPAEIETAAYFVACEGLTNAVKHAAANRVALRVAHQDGRLVVSVADDGVGGAVPRIGSGLTGLSDRVAARGGSLRIDSIPGQGTTLTAEIPCAS
ncbi:MAG TPA: sensor histidine kinase [Jiangellales bacterium]|nr:sensor histidine kinase [Jiangellales bacterium]